MKEKNMDEPRNDAEAQQPAAPGATTPPAAAQAPPEPQPPPGRHRYGRRWETDPYHPFDPRRKSPFLASFLSLMPGLGQIYVGYYQAGFIHPLVVATIIVLLSQHGTGNVAPFLGFFLAFFWLYNIIDAGRRAAYYNQILEGNDAVGLPKGFLAPGGGSLTGGMFLIIIGGMLLANTALDISMEWVEDWWPLVPILFGVYLVVKAAKEKLPTGNGRD
jgi:TM2 domain-containing membrane protein YozV